MPLKKIIKKTAKKVKKAAKKLYKKSAHYELKKIKQKQFDREFKMRMQLNKVSYDLSLIHI